jgi:hypothetical protein
MKNNTLAIVAAVPAIAPKPKIAATIAITKNVMVQRNIRLDFIVNNNIKRQQSYPSISTL